jgi:ribosomal protein L40E
LTGGTAWLRHSHNVTSPNHTAYEQPPSQKYCHDKITESNRRPTMSRTVISTSSNLLEDGTQLMYSLIKYKVCMRHAAHCTSAATVCTRCRQQQCTNPDAQQCLFLASFVTSTYLTPAVLPCPSRESDTRACVRASVSTQSCYHWSGRSILPQHLAQLTLLRCGWTL